MQYLSFTILEGMQLETSDICKISMFNSRISKKIKLTNNQKLQHMRNTEYNRWKVMSGKDMTRFLNECLLENIHNKQNDW